MRASSVLIALGLAAVCSCCATVASPLQTVQPGMTARQVEEAIGPPCTVEPHGGRTRTEIWHYDEGVVILDGGRVTHRFARPEPKT